MYQELRIPIEQIGVFNFEHLCNGVSNYNNSIKDKKSRGVAVSMDNAKREIVVLFKNHADVFHLGVYFGKSILESPDINGYRNYFQQ